MTSGPILVVESDRDLGHAIAEQLAADGYRVELARTAQHARILAGASAPSLAVLGCVELQRGAVQLLEEIRVGRSGEASWDGALPVIVLGSGVRALDVLRAFDAGADDYLAGPAGYLELRGFNSSTARTATSSKRPGKSETFGHRDTPHVEVIGLESREKSR